MSQDVPVAPRRWLLPVLATCSAAVAVGAFVAAGAFLRDALTVTVPRLTEGELRELVWTTVQSETEQAFLLTGLLEVAATTEVEDTKVLLPSLLALNLGTTRSTVRVPGRIHYGVDVSGLHRQGVRLVGDTVLEIRLPAPEVRAVEARLARAEVHTDVGWARLRSRSGLEAERRAIGLVENALRRQGAVHVRDSSQPGVNTALAFERLLEPALAAAGAGDLRLRVLVDRAGEARRGT